MPPAPPPPPEPTVPLASEEALVTSADHFLPRILTSDSEKALVGSEGNVFFAHQLSVYTLGEAKVARWLKLKLQVKRGTPIFY
jgi:hypothetical protein